MVKRWLDTDCRQPFGHSGLKTVTTVSNREKASGRAEERNWKAAIKVIVKFLKACW